jgi:Leucine-rich repeat (LRR) protein
VKKNLNSELLFLKMMKLTPALLSTTIPKGFTIATVKELNLSNKEIDEIEDLSVCLELKKLNISKNRLSTLDSVSFNMELTWLDVSNNNIGSLEKVKKLKKLNGTRDAHHRSHYILSFKCESQ